MTTTLAAIAVGGASGIAEVPVKQTYFELRRYALIAGPQPWALIDTYLANALIPALNRINIAPIGAFRLDIGPETPSLCLLLPSTSLDTLVNASAALAQDAAYTKAAEPFDTGTIFRRIDSQLMAAFDDFTCPPLASPAPKRIFQLRTYESPTPDAHLRKVEMFQQAEIGLFREAGLHPVFFARNLIGANLPSLTYMLTFKDMAELEANWHTFSSNSAWKKLAGTPGNGDDALIRTITNLILSPKPYSQI